MPNPLQEILEGTQLNSSQIDLYILNHYEISSYVNVEQHLLNAPNHGAATALMA
jgi:hypothetical protein